MATETFDLSATLVCTSSLTAVARDSSEDLFNNPNIQVIYTIELAPYALPSRTLIKPDPGPGL